jgi:hypothetical protein
MTMWHTLSPKIGTNFVDKRPSLSRYNNYDQILTGHINGLLESVTELREPLNCIHINSDYSDLLFESRTLTRSRNDVITLAESQDVVRQKSLHTTTHGGMFVVTFCVQGLHLIAEGEATMGTSCRANRLLTTEMRKRWATQQQRA